MSRYSDWVDNITCTGGSALVVYALKAPAGPKTKVRKTWVDFCGTDASVGPVKVEFIKATGTPSAATAVTLSTVPMVSASPVLASVGGYIAPLAQPYITFTATTGLTFDAKALETHRWSPAATATMPEESLGEEIELYPAQLLCIRITPLSGHDVNVTTGMRWEE